MVAAGVKAGESASRGRNSLKLCEGLRSETNPNVSAATISAVSSGIDAMPLSLVPPRLQYGIL